MSDLISGKEAKLAWANGVCIELCYKQYKEENTWFKLLSSDELSTFDRDDLLFRIKPKTITINGIEVPEPFEPKEGDVVWCVSDDHGCGYCAYTWSKNHSVVIGTWKSEEEIKQVVAALRSIFNVK